MAMIREIWKFLKIDYVKKENENVEEVKISDKRYVKIRSLPTLNIISQ